MNRIVQLFQLIEVVARKENIRALADTATEQLAGEMLVGDANRIMQFRIESDIINQIKRLFYHIRRIAKKVAVSEQK